MNMDISKKLFIGVLLINAVSLLAISGLINNRASSNSRNMVESTLMTVQKKQTHSYLVLDKGFADVETTLAAADKKTMAIMMGLYKTSYQTLVEATANQIFPMIENFDFDSAGEVVKKLIKNAPAVKWIRLETANPASRDDIFEFGKKAGGDTLLFNHKIRTDFAFLRISMQISTAEMTALNTVRALMAKINADNRNLAAIIKNDAGQTLATAKIKARADSEKLGARMLTQSIIMVIILLILTGVILVLYIRKVVINPINSTVAGLSNNSEMVAGHAKSMSASSVTVADAARQQAASLEETSASLEEISAMTRQNADNSGMACRLMKRVSEVMAKADAMMKQLNASMDEMTRASDQTSQINKTIDEIAFQTNLLALNAAVEAARAGEAGAGFAVVADEVRNLAMRAAEAAKNSESLIKQTLSTVAEGSRLSRDVGETFSGMNEQINEAVNIVNEIATASNEQSKGISQLNIAVADQDKLVQQNAFAASNFDSTARDLARQVEMLDEMISRLSLMIGGGNKPATGEPLPLPPA